MDYEQINLELTKFFCLGKAKLFRRKEVIASIYVNTDKVFWIENGFVKVVTYNGRGAQLIYHLYGPGDIFPITVLTQAPYCSSQFIENANFIAVGNVTVRERLSAEYSALVTKRPQLLLQTLTQQDFIYDRLYNFTMHSAMHKAAYRLLSLANRFGKIQDDHIVVDLPLTIQEIADTINVSRETTGRVLNELEEEGYIMLSRKSLLLYPAPLEKLIGVKH